MPDHARTPSATPSPTGVATIALDQPDTRNALSDELLDDLLAALARGQGATTTVRCVVLASTHEKVFSAGGNLAGFAAEVPLVHKHFGDRAVPASCSRRSASSASRRSAPPAATCSPARSGSRWPAT